MNWEQKNDITPENLKPGDLLVNHGGATMRWNTLLQVIRVEGKKVFLGVPECDGEGNQAGHNWVAAKATNPEVTHHAKFHGGRLVFCGNAREGWAMHAHWKGLYRTEIGERHSFYGD